MSHRGDGNNNSSGHSSGSQHNDTHRHHESRPNDDKSLHVQNIRHTNPSPVDHRVLRCFCGCTPLRFDQIERFAMMPASIVVTHPIASTLFRNFLRVGHRTDKSNALLSLECHELCDKIINNASTDNGSDIDALIELCPSFEWEEKVNNAIVSDKTINDKRNLTQVLHEMKRECVRCIECHNDFDRFRKELLRKIGKKS